MGPPEPLKDLPCTEVIADHAKELAIAEVSSTGNGGRDQIGKTRLVDLKPCWALSVAWRPLTTSYPSVSEGSANPR